MNQENPKSDEWRRGDYLISTDRNRLSIDAVHAFLHQHSYWAVGIPREVVERSIQNALIFGIYHGIQQVGFARVVTDFATFAWIGDVFVIEEYRGRGLSKWLMETIVAHPQLQGLRRWLLATRDAEGLYQQYGFKPLAHPERFYERHFPDVYKA